MFLFNVWQYLNTCHLWTSYLANVDTRGDEEQMRRERLLKTDSYLIRIDS